MRVMTWYSLKCTWILMVEFACTVQCIPNGSSLDTVNGVGRSWWLWDMLEKMERLMKTGRADATTRSVGMISVKMKGVATLMTVSERAIL